MNYFSKSVDIRFRIGDSYLFETFRHGRWIFFKVEARLSRTKISINRPDLVIRPSDLSVSRQLKDCPFPFLLTINLWPDSIIMLKLPTKFTGLFSKHTFILIKTFKNHKELHNWDFSPSITAMWISTWVLVLTWVCGF